MFLGVATLRNQQGTILITNCHNLYRYNRICQLISILSCEPTAIFVNILATSSLRAHTELHGVVAPCGGVDNKVQQLHTTLSELFPCSMLHYDLPVCNCKQQLTWISSWACASIRRQIAVRKSSRRRFKSTYSTPSSWQPHAATCKKY